MRCFGEEAPAGAIAHATMKVFSSESRSCGGVEPPDRGAEGELLLGNAETAPARLVWTAAEAELLRGKRRRAKALPQRRS
jgi:hypothetical protein